MLQLFLYLKLGIDIIFKKIFSVPNMYNDEENFFKTKNVFTNLDLFLVQIMSYAQIFNFSISWKKLI